MPTATSSSGSDQPSRRATRGDEPDDRDQREDVERGMHQFIVLARTSWTWWTRSCRKYRASESTVKTEPLLRRPGRSSSGSRDRVEVGGESLGLLGQLGPDGVGVLLPVALGQRGLVLVPVREQRVGAAAHHAEPCAEDAADVPDVAGVLERRPHLRRGALGGVRRVEAGEQRATFSRVSRPKSRGATERRRIRSRRTGGRAPTSSPWCRRAGRPARS